MGNKLSISLLLILSACSSPKADPRALQAMASNTQGDTLSCQLQFPQSHLCGSLAWETPPHVGADNSLTLFFWDASSSANKKDPAKSFQLQFKNLSTQALSPPVISQRKSSGTYHISDLLMLDKGEWSLQVQLFDTTNVIDAAEFHFKF